MKDWLDHYCQRHRDPGARFGVVDWFITIAYWIVMICVCYAIAAFLWSVVRFAIG